MAKSIFRISAHLKESVLSIKELSGRLVGVLYKLGKVDDCFLNPIYSKGETNRSIKLKGNAGDEILILANSILDSHKEEIEHRSIHYSREEGFRFLFTFKKNNSADETYFSITGRIGCLGYPEFNVEYINHKCDYSYDWYLNVLKTIIETLNPNYGCIQLIMPSILSNTRHLKYPLGWVTYFSDNLSKDIPKNFDEVEYKPTNGGIYLILTKEDFTTSQIKFNQVKNRLFKMMEEFNTNDLDLLT